jgi:hypothetical protein
VDERCRVAGERDEQRVARVDGVGDGSDLRATGEILDVSPLVGGRHRDDGAAGPRPGRTPGAVEVRLVLGRRIDVHDEADLVDVDASRSDVRGDEHAHLTGRELDGIAA